MLRTICTLIITLSVFVPGNAWQAKATAEQRGGYISPSEVNVRIEPDVRTFVVMAAVNLAGFDFETAGEPLSPARAELRKDLARVDPRIKQKLTDFYKSHRPAGLDEAAYASRYAALSLTMTPPPAFSVFQPAGAMIPPDLQSIADFAPLVRELYLSGGIKELIPKYIGVADVYAKAYNRPVGETIYQVLEYFHTVPETVINMRPLVIRSGEPGNKKSKEQVISRNRSRQVFVIPDPLAAMDTAAVRGDFLNQKEDLLVRRVGDDYMVLVGPSRTANTEAIRQALIRFVIDPMVERHLKQSLEYKDQIAKLVAAVPTASKEYGASVYLVIRESLALATEARLRRIDSMRSGASYSEDDATYDLAQAYLRGAVLVFHFYDSLKGLEQVGINIEDFFDQMVATTKFEREETRAKDFEQVVARVAAARAAKKPASATPQPVTAVGVIAKKVLDSDALIRSRSFKEARALLEEILVAEPNNARALYGLARVLNQEPSIVEQDSKSDEDDKIQAQHERLEQAIKLYRKAIANASRDTEMWLVQWSHVYLGRILDFQEFRADAINEYEKAIALGPNITNGAYKEALEGKQRPYGQQ